MTTFILTVFISAAALGLVLAVLREAFDCLEIKEVRRRCARIRASCPRCGYVAYIPDFVRDPRQEPMTFLCPRCHHTEDH